MVLSYDENSAFEIEERFSEQYRIVLRIVPEIDESGEQRIDYNIDSEDNIIEYHCYNFDNPLGTGTSEPIIVATYNEKKIVIQFWIYVMRNEKAISRKLEYSLWMEK